MEVEKKLIAHILVVLDLQPYSLPSSLPRRGALRQAFTMFIKLSVLAAIAGLVSAAPSPSALNHVVHEKRDAPLHGWSKTDRLEKDAVIPMRIGLTQTNLDKGYDMLMEVYVFRPGK